MSHLIRRFLRGRPPRIDPRCAVGHRPDEMPGIEKVVCIKEGDRWNVRIFPDASGMIASGAALQINIAAGLYGAIVAHNEKQPH